MKILNPKSKKSKPAPVAKNNAATQPPAPPAEPEVPSREAFLEDAKNEGKRKLITDHIETILVLRNEKRFTFRAIAEWLAKRGIEADHSSVYRAFLASIPPDHRDPGDPDYEEYGADEPL